MVIYHAHRLHERVADGAADKSETPPSSGLCSWLGLEDVEAGTSSSFRQWFMTGSPSTKSQMKLSKLPRLSFISSMARAFVTVLSTLRRLRMIPGSSRRLAILLGVYRAIFSGSKPSNTLR